MFILIKNPDGISVLCKAGKGRTYVMIYSYLNIYIYVKWVKKLFDIMRENTGVTIPNQKIYIKYILIRIIITIIKNNYFFILFSINNDNNIFFLNIYWPLRIGPNP